MKKTILNIMALVVAIAALAVSVSAQTKAGLNACFDGEGVAGLGTEVKTDFNFEGVAFLLELEVYDSGKTVTVYGKYRGTSSEKNELGVFEYSFVRFLPSCGKKDTLVGAIKKAFPGYKVKFFGEKDGVQRAKEAAGSVKDGTVNGAKRVWEKVKPRQKP